MEFSIEFAGDPQDVTVTVSGPGDLAGFALLNERLVSDPRFRAGLSYLIDFSELEVAELPQEDVEQIAGVGGESTWNYPPRAVAMVATNPTTRAQAQLAIAYMGGSKSGHRVFATREDAVAWLREQ
ncbi:MAG TPA: hypothetical protein VGN06_08755 [Gaiellaceae bacterium]